LALETNGLFREGFTVCVMILSLTYFIR